MLITKHNRILLIHALTLYNKNWAELLDITKYFDNKMETVFWSINLIYLKTFLFPLFWADIFITDLFCIVQYD